MTFYHAFYRQQQPTIIIQRRNLLLNETGATMMITGLIESLEQRLQSLPVIDFRIFTITTRENLSNLIHSKMMMTLILISYSVHWPRRERRLITALEVYQLGMGI
jgi:hypothetical protein